MFLRFHYKRLIAASEPESETLSAYQVREFSVFVAANQRLICNHQESEVILLVYITRIYLLARQIGGGFRICHKMTCTSVNLANSGELAKPVGSVLERSALGELSASAEAALAARLVSRTIPSQTEKAISLRASTKRRVICQI